MARIAVFDVGGTYIKHAVMDGRQLTEPGRVPTPQDTQERFLEAIEGILDQMGQVEGIAFSMPGVIDVDRRYMYAGGSLVYNHRTDVAAWEERFGLPVELENDARSSALAELELGTMRGVRTGLVVTFGTGTGGGVIVDGRVHKGGHLIAGEISVVYADDPARGSAALLGNIGGVNNMARAIGEAAGVPCERGEEAFALVAAGNEGACAAFDARCDTIVRAFYNFQCLLDPERIAIGGGVSANPLFLEGLQRAMERFYQRFPLAFPHAELVCCRFRNAANLLGAYLHYAHRHGLVRDIDIEEVA